jgi:hypothetical protein
MPSTVAQIKYVNPARDGYKPSIKTEDGQTYGCKEEKLSLFEKGRTYKIEYSERSFNGKTYRNVESAAPVETGIPSQNPPQTGAASPGALATPPQSGNSEQIFVCALLKEGIRSGHIKIEKASLWEATNLFRGLWRASFGTNTFTASDAGGRMMRG